MLDTELRKALQSALGPERLIEDKAALELYSSDLFKHGAPCLAVIRPRNAADLARAVELITTAGLAITPRGGGLTYVEGYTLEKEGYVVVDCADLNRILEINEEDLYIAVEAGVTWKQINDALAPRGLRLPFFGTFSGAGATVGGGLSNGAMFLGSARYGSVAEIVLSLQLVLADGSILETGQLGIRNSRPFYRSYGPDLTGLFVHDAGAFGIKTQAAFRLIRKPEYLDYLSFLVSDIGAATQILSEISRSDLVEEIYIVDPVRTRQRLKDGSLLGDISMLGKVVGQEKGLLRGLKSGFDLVKGGKNFLDQDLYSVHMVFAGRHLAAVSGDVDAARSIALKLGATEIPNSIPKASRAAPFADLSAVLGAEGDRWVALNCKVAHSDANRLVSGADEIFKRHAKELSDSGVTITLLISAMSNHVFSYECVFRWFDEWMPLHKSSHPRLERLTEPKANPEAQAIIERVRQEIVDYFFEFGAASSQIGRTYRYSEALKPEPLKLVSGVKALLDPDNLINPGALLPEDHAGKNNRGNR